jgi:hypothetical protein
MSGQLIRNHVLVNFTLRPGVVTQTAHVTSAPPLPDTKAFGEVTSTVDEPYDSREVQLAVKFYE